MSAHHPERSTRVGRGGGGSPGRCDLAGSCRVSWAFQAVSYYEAVAPEPPSAILGGSLRSHLARLIFASAVEPAVPLPRALLGKGHMAAWARPTPEGLADALTPPAVSGNPARCTAEASWSSASLAHRHLLPACGTPETLLIFVTH